MGNRRLNRFSVVFSVGIKVILKKTVLEQAFDSLCGIQMKTEVLNEYSYSLMWFCHYIGQLTYHKSAKAEGDWLAENSGREKIW